MSFPGLATAGMPLRSAPQGSGPKSGPQVSGGMRGWNDYGASNAERRSVGRSDREFVCRRLGDQQRGANNSVRFDRPCACRRRGSDEEPGVSMEEWERGTTGRFEGPRSASRNPAVELANEPDRGQGGMVITDGIQARQGRTGACLDRPGPLRTVTPRSERLAARVARTALSIRLRRSVSTPVDASRNRPTAQRTPRRRARRASALGEVRWRVAPLAGAAAQRRARRGPLAGTRPATHAAPRPSPPRRPRSTPSPCPWIPHRTMLPGLHGPPAHS